MSAARLSRSVEVIEQGIARGLHIGAQLYVSVAGQPRADLAFGDARPGVAMGTRTLMLWLSAGKPLTAVAIAQLWEQGQLGLDDPVAMHIPEFAAHGKERVTVRHLLTHTSGLRLVASNWSRASWQQIIARICASTLEEGQIPGQTAGYSAATNWFMLGEILHRITGQPLDQWVRDRILLPAGMKDSWLALPPERYRDYDGRVGWLHDTTSSPPRPHPNWDSEESARLCRPGANSRGPIRELGRFYEVLLNGGACPGPDRQHLLGAQTIAAMTARQRAGMIDRTFRHAIDWGLGFLLNSPTHSERLPYGFGPHASPTAFGHGGAQCANGMADPDRQLVIAYVLNGTPGEPAHQERNWALMTAIYEDLGFTR